MPPSHAYADEDLLEEERRLLYVAVTRAKEFLYLCCPQRVYQRNAGFHSVPLSLFLRELPGGNYFQEGDEVEAYTSSTGKTKVEEEAGFCPGDAVRHPIFGRGKVIAVPDRVKVQIKFEDGRTRLLHLGFAPLERVASVY